MNLVFSVQNLFTSHVQLSNLYSALVRSDGGRSLRRESQDAEFLLDGFPRSGNTFASHVVRMSFPDAKFIHHFHNVAALKAAKKKGLPRFVFLRDPKEAVSSLLLLHEELRSKFRFYPAFMRSDSFRIDLYLRRYRAFYRYVSGDRSTVIIPSQKLFESPSDLIKRVSEAISREPADTVGSEGGGGEDYFQRKESQSSNRPLSSGVPNREKQIRKHEIVELMYKNKNLADALQVYRSLLDRAEG